ncbi:MAG: hypothetical protein L3J96_03580 [Thermoplasmata archaeon]|nr:hypothetical protein [Thermoplasmata archaeon]
MTLSLKKVYAHPGPALRCQRSCGLQDAAGGRYDHPCLVDGVGETGQHPGAHAYPPKCGRNRER